MNKEPERPCTAMQRLEVETRQGKNLELDLPGLSNTMTFFDAVKLYKALLSVLLQTTAYMGFCNILADVVTMGHSSLSAAVPE